VAEDMANTTISLPRSRVFDQIFAAQMVAVKLPAIIRSASNRVRRSSRNEKRSRCAEIALRQSQVFGFTLSALKVGSFQTLSFIHPGDDVVVRVIQNARVTGVLDREKFHKRKLAGQLATHSNRNHFTSAP